MKTKISRIGRKTLSIVIVMMMIVSTMLVGMVSASAASTIPNSMTLYLDYSGLSWWGDASACVDAYFVGSDTAWVEMEKIDGSLYKCTTPSSGTYTTVRFTRYSEHITNINTAWNKTDTISYSANCNTYKITGTGSTAGTWSYQEYSEKYYIGGRFRVRTSADSAYTYTYDTGNWLGDSTKIALTDDDGDGIFTLNTYCTLTELSEKLPESGTQYDPLFFIHKGDGSGGTWYGKTSGIFNASTTSITLDDNSNESTDSSNGLIKFSGTSDENVIINFNPTTKELSYVLEGADPVTDGKYKIETGTSENGTLKFTGSGNTTEGTANANDTVTVTVTPNEGYACSSIEVTGADGSAITASGSDGSYTFTMPAQNVTVSATYEEVPVKPEHIKDTSALWLDVNPSINNTSTLIKWDKYTGSSHGTTSDYRFYVAKNVDLTQATVYNGYSSSVTLNGTTISANSSAVVNLPVGEYTPSGATTSKVTVMQGSTDAMFINQPNGDLPTAVGEGGESKDDTKIKGGSVITMSNDSDTPAFSDALVIDNIKGRGNSSWEASNSIFGKYAFNMKLDSATHLFGMDAAESTKGSKSWCLLANNADESMLRNALTYDLANELGLPYAPEFRFVDIYDNNVYMGSYLVTEKVDVGDKKLIKGEAFDDINEELLADGEKIYEKTDGWIQSGSVGTAGSYQYTDNYKNTTVTTSPTYNTRGTYLLEFEITERCDNEASWFVSNQGQNVVVKSPEFATKEQVLFVQEKFNAMETAIFNGADVDELSNYMDVESFVKMYLIQELSANLDSAATSYYIMLDCSNGADNARFVASPVWDYDWAYGQYRYRDEYNAKYAVDGSILHPEDPDAWLAKVKTMDDSASKSGKYSIQSKLADTNDSFQSLIKKVWNDSFYSTIQTYYTEDGQIDQWYDEISASLSMNDKRWGFVGSDPIYSWGSNDTGDTYSDAVDYLKNDWTATRVNWLNTEIQKYSDYTVTELATPTVKAYASDGTTELTGSVEAGSTYIIEATTDDLSVTYVLYDNGTQVASNTTGKFEITAVEGTHSYTVKTTSGDVTSSASTAVSVTVSAGTVVISSDWSVVGSFNNWDATRNPMSGTGPYTASIYLPANSTGYTFKIKDNNATDNAHYGYYQGAIDDEGTLTLNNTSTVSGGSNGNITLKATGGVYTFTWNGTSLQVSVAKSDDYNLTSTITVPESVGVGETFDVTVNSVPSENFPTAKYYRYTIAVDGTKIANGVELASTTYTCKTSISADATVTYYVEAYDENRVLLGLSATGTQTVKGIVSDFTVGITSDEYEISKNGTITLTAVVTPAGYAKSYEFFKSTDGSTFTSMGTASTSSSLAVNCTEEGKFYYKVKVVNKYDTSVTKESYVIEINVYNNPGKHYIDVYFKSASSFIYKPTLTCNGVTYEMTRDFEPVYNEDGTVLVQPYIGDAYSGSLKYYWYKTTEKVLVDSSKENTLTFTTARTQLNATFEGKFHGNTYFMAADNLMSDTVALDITHAAEYIRNYYHSPLHMTSMGDDADYNLGFTNINGTTYRMGELLNSNTETSSFSIKSATTMQKLAAGLTEVSDLQENLLDVNLDGVVNVSDATLMQKALVSA